ncbi:ABC transporter ATP-binding protein [Spiroplasma floricola]|uniref:ABC transporter ATP-binding protein n=1 Tax=Spiroplasma floricola 23-6 TaxID=1336749 RepID=A0A2K8SEI2_9MOLU|nr:ABC transporter ATP-binding protein [Spiroplasma floricola]AUB31250.1 ABC transporter ATP-binding protein [Spiroplasma floricola 23-6]
MLEIKSMSKKFDNEKGIFNFSLELKEGEIIGLVGDNGSGKSTMLKSLFGEYKKDEGEILLNGESLLKNLTSISFFPDQSVYPKDITILNFAIYDGILCGIEKKEVEQRLDILLEKFNLLDYKTKKFNSLSAGMQKKALLAITLISRPKFIFLDEPTANLDVKSRTDFHKILKSLAKNNKVGILITSHIIDELEGFINKLVIIEKGIKKYDSQFDSKKENILPIYKKFTENKEIKNFEDLY